MVNEEIFTATPWLGGHHPPAYPELASDARVDIAVVGGGITGATLAYLLKQAGYTVALVERRRCGGGQTSRSTAHLTALPDRSLAALVETFGTEGARAVWNAGFAAIARIRGIVRDERINCQFAWVPGFLHAAAGLDPATARREIAREADAAQTLGIDATYLDDVPGIGRPGLRFDAQARLHPLRYLEVLLDRIEGDGSHVFEHTEVDAVEDEPCAIRARGHRIAADGVVIATHVPPASLIGERQARGLAARLAHAHAYALAGLAVPGALAEGLYWEHVAAPYEYLRIDRRRGVDEVLFGGRDRRVGEPDDPRDALASLEARLLARVPGVRVTHRWTGEIVETDDGLPYIGEIAPRLFVATGFSGTGMTFGTLAGMMVADALAGRANPWSAMFAPGRTRGRARSAGASLPSHEPAPAEGASATGTVTTGREGLIGRLRPAPTLAG